MANYLVITEREELNRVPRFIKSRCTGCGECLEVCPVDAVSGDADKKQISIDSKQCIKCGTCVDSCEPGALV